MFDLVIRGGALPDIGIEGEYIAAVGRGLAGGREEIDASNLAILPGLIDCHVHFNEPGRTDWEGGATGSRSLAAGGGTLFIDMPLNSSPCTVNAKAFDEKRAALEAASITDFALWGGIVPGNLSEMAGLAGRGAVGFKAFMCDSGLPEFPQSDGNTLRSGMREAARLGLPVAVHAESPQLLTRESRPVAAEVAAIREAGAFARDTGCRLHVVHISSGSGVAAALEQRRLGADISIETCPHYLYFTGDDVERIGALLKCAPPLRSAEERDALRGCPIDIVGSDHSPCPPEMKNRAVFSEIWGGIAGVQSTLNVLFDIGWPLDRISAVTATHPARRFRLGNRGEIKPGNYADITLFDTNTSTETGPENLLSRHRMSPYSGRTMKGAVRRTIRRGETIFRDGVVTSRTKGRFVHAHA